MVDCLHRAPVMRRVKPLLDGHPQGVSVSLDDALRVTCLIRTATISPSSEWKKGNSPGHLVGGGIDRSRLSTSQRVNGTAR